MKKKVVMMVVTMAMAAAMMTGCGAKGDTDAQGASYAFTLDGEKPAGLDDAKIRDKVTVTYTGEISEVDPFEGEVLSVEVSK